MGTPSAQKEEKENVKTIAKPSDMPATAHVEGEKQVIRDPSEIRVTGSTERYVSNVAPPNSQVETTTIEVKGKQDVALPLMKKMPFSWDYEVLRFKNGVPPQVTLKSKYRMTGNLANPKVFRLMMDEWIDKITSTYMGIFQDVNTVEVPWLGSRFVEPSNYETDFISRLKDDLSVAEFDEVNYTMVKDFWEIPRRHTTDVNPMTEFALFMKVFFFFAFKEDIDLQQTLQRMYLEHYTLSGGNGLHAIERFRELIKRLFENKYRKLADLPYDLELSAIRVLWRRPNDVIQQVLANRKNEAFRNIFLNYILKIAQTNNLLPFSDITKTLQDIVADMNTNLTKVTKKNFIIQAFSGQHAREFANLIALWQSAPKFTELEFPHTIQEANDASAVADALLWALILPAECMSAKSRRTIRAIIAIGFLFELKKEYFNPGLRSRQEYLRVYEESDADVLQQLLPLVKNYEGKEDVKGAGNVATALSLFDSRNQGSGFYYNDPDVIIVTQGEDRELFGQQAGYVPLWGNPAFGDDIPALRDRLERFSLLFELDKSPLKNFPSSTSLWEALFAMFRALSFKTAELTKISWAMNEMARNNCLVMSFPAKRVDQLANNARKVLNPNSMALWSFVLLSDVSKLNPTINLPVQSIVHLRSAIDWTMTCLGHYKARYFDTQRYPDSWFSGKRERWAMVFKALKSHPSTFDATPATTLAKVFEEKVINEPNLETFEMPNVPYDFEVKIERTVEEWIRRRLPSMGIAQKCYFCPKPVKKTDIRLKRGYFVLDPEMKIGFTYDYETLSRDLISNRGEFQRRLLKAQEDGTAIEFKMLVPVQPVEYDSEWSIDEIFKVEGNPAVVNVGPIKFPFKRPGNRDDIYNTSLKMVMYPLYVIAEDDLPAVEPNITVEQMLPQIGGEVLAFKKNAKFIGPSELPNYTTFISTQV
jgi:hypothetical protein